MRITKRSVMLVLVVVIATAIFLLVKRSMPYSDRPELLSAEVSIDSIWSLGPAAAIYDSAAREYYWLKSYTSFDQSALDTLRGVQVKVRYMKFFRGPLENRIFRIEVGSAVVFDQVVERE